MQDIKYGLRVIDFALVVMLCTGPNGFSFYSNPVPQIAEQHGVSVQIYSDDTQLYHPLLSVKQMQTEL